MEVYTKFEFRNDYSLREIFIHISNPPKKIFININPYVRINTYRWVDYTSVERAKDFIAVNDISSAQKGMLIKFLLSKGMRELE